LLWIPLTLSPVMLFGRFGDVVLADRFLYIPSVGAVLLAALVVQEAFDVLGRPLGRRFAVAGLVGLTLVLAVNAGQRSRVWRSDYALFSEMVRTSPGSALVHSNLGMAQYERGELEPAVRSFETAVTLNPEFAMAYNNLAAALERRGRFEAAILHYNKALQFAPGLLEARANAGNLLVRMGYPRTGLPLLESLAREHADYAPGLHALADSYYRLGRPEAALPLLLRVLAREPRYAPAHYLLGEVHHRAGREVAAADSLRRFLALWPENDEHAAGARRILAEIEFGS
jgi:tetratricopeptide (TPR) repeat protein